LTTTHKKLVPGPKKPNSLAFLSLLIFTVIILPLAYSTSSLDPVLMIRLLLLSSFLFIFAIVFFNPKTFVKLNFQILRLHLFKWWLGYLLMTVFSVLFAINFTEGFFDIFKTATIFILLLVLSIIFSNQNDWNQKLPLFVAFAALIAVAIGFYQYFDRVLMSSQEVLPDGKPIIYAVKGLMAHKNQFSNSMLLMIPFLGYGVFVYRGWRRWLTAISLLLVFFLIIILQTRAVWLAIIVAGVFSAIFFGFASQSFGYSKNIRKYLIIVLAIFSLLLVLGLTFGENNTYIVRLKSIVNPQSHDNIYRLKIWEISMDMAADYPITGVGAGNWQLNMANYIQGLDLKKDQLNWVRPHNDFIWVLTEKGIFGLILFLSLFATAFWFILNIVKSNHPVKDKIFALFLFFGLMSYLVISFFDFPYERINQQVYVALMMASLAALAFRKDVKLTISKSYYLGFFAATLLILLFAIIFSFQAWQQENHLRKARVALNQKNWKVMLDEAKLAETPFKTLDVEAIPVDWFIGLAYFSLDDTENAIVHYEKAKLANPTLITVLNNLGQAYFKKKDYKNAEINYLAALDILPTYREALFNISAVYFYKQDYQKALDALQKIEDKNDKEISKRIEQLRKMVGKE